MANRRTRDVHWRLDPDVVEQLEQMADDKGWSVAYLVNDILKQELPPSKESNGVH